MSKNIIDIFIGRYDPRPEGDVSHPGPSELTAMQDQLAALVEKLPLQNLDEEQRKDMAGKRFPEQIDLMYECANGLRRCPEIAAVLGAKAEDFETVARQDMSMGGFIKAMQAIQSGADTGLLILASDGDKLCGDVAQQVRALVHGDIAGADDGQRKALDFAFSEAATAR